MQVNDRIGRRLKLHDLNVLLAVAQVGSMSKAAALLHTTQSAVSRSIADLEHAVGARLLDRGPQGVEPTEYGRALLNRGVAAFGELQQGIRDIEHLSDPGAGELNIGSSTSMAEGIVLSIIERLSQEYPRAVFHVLPGVLPGLYHDLRSRRIELGLFAQPNADVDEDVNCEVLLEDGLVVVTGLDNPLARRRKINLAELLQERWTWPEAGTGFDASVVQAFRASGLKPPRATVYAQAINMRTRLAADGRFLAVVPAHIMQLRSSHLPLKVLPVKLPGTQRQTGIVTLRNRTLSPLAQRFIAHAREIAGQLVSHRLGRPGNRKVVNVS